MLLLFASPNTTAVFSLTFPSFYRNKFATFNPALSHNSLFSPFPLATRHQPLATRFCGTPSQSPSPNTVAPPAFHADNSSGSPSSPAPPAAIPSSSGPAAYSP